MGQITSGIRSILSYPAIYDMLQDIMGAKKVRRELADEFINPGADCRILDMGCGTGEILDYLPASVDYWGYDISPEYIAAAEMRFGNRGRFSCKLLDEAELITLPKFDRILAIGVLHHLNDHEVESFYELASKALAPGGKVVTMDPCLLAGQNPIARYLISKDRGQNVREAEQYAALTKHAFSITKGTIRHRVWIPYTHWIMECSN